jgi:hypothetical protein
MDMKLLKKFHAVIKKADRLLGASGNLGPIDKKAVAALGEKLERLATEVGFDVGPELIISGLPVESRWLTEAELLNMKQVRNKLTVLMEKAAQ